MAQWYFRPNSIQEGPLAWVIPLDRYRMDRGVSIVETSHNVFEEGRYFSYTDLNAVLAAGLRVFRGGYIYVVSDQDKSDLIANVADITSANFTPYP